MTTIVQPTIVQPTILQPRPTEAGPLAAMLAAPPTPAGLDDLPGQWRRTVIELGLARPRGLEDGPWLEGAVRGALGHALAHLPPPGPGLPTPQALLFQSQAMLTRRLPVPKPFVIEIDRTGRDLTLRLVLFGLAGRWRRELLDGLLAMLDAGLTLREAGGMRVPFQPLAAAWWRTERVAVPEAPDRAILRFTTPLRLRASGPLGTTPADLVFAMVERAAGLARWQGLLVEPDWSGWRNRGKTIGADSRAMRPLAWERRSSLQGKRFAMAGLLGDLVLHNPPEALMPVLALGATAHVGAHTSLGLGRYELICT